MQSGIIMVDVLIDMATQYHSALIGRCLVMRSHCVNGTTSIRFTIFCSLYFRLGILFVLNWNCSFAGLAQLLSLNEPWYIYTNSDKIIYGINFINFWVDYISDLELSYKKYKYNDKVYRHINASYVSDWNGEIAHEHREIVRHRHILILECYSREFP